MSYSQELIYQVENGINVALTPIQPGDQLGFLFGLIFRTMKNAKMSNEQIKIAIHVGLEYAIAHDIGSGSLQQSVKKS